jgi:hypothetical protein
MIISYETPFTTKHGICSPCPVASVVKGEALHLGTDGNAMYPERGPPEQHTQSYEAGVERTSRVGITRHARVIAALPSQSDRPPVTAVAREHKQVIRIVAQ